jgi:hypothetical protein
MADYNWSVCALQQNMYKPLLHRSAGDGKMCMYGRDGAEWKVREYTSGDAGRVIACPYSANDMVAWLVSAQAIPAPETK